MPDNKPMKVNRRHEKNMLVPALILIVTALLVSLAIAVIWQAVSGDDAKLAASSSEAAELARLAQRSSSSEVSSSVPQSSSEPESSSVPEADEPPMIEGALPESERVKSVYFDDAVFVGDSITTGIQLYNVMANTKVLAGTGINLDTIYTADVVKLEDGSRITIMDGLKEEQYKKLYVMLGGNEVRDVSKDVFIDRYGKLLDDIRALQPGAMIYVQSVLPVTANNNYKMDNQRIDEFNVALASLCAEKKVYYLNVAEVMKDETGMLPDEASPADGMHFGPDYYNKWFEYLKTHTVQS